MSVYICLSVSVWQIAHVNVMTKLDLLSGDARKRLDRYLDPDMTSVLADALQQDEQAGPSFSKLNHSLASLVFLCHVLWCSSKCKKCKKVAHTRLPSVGFWSWSRFLTVSLQVTWVMNPTVGCHYFPPGPQFPPQPLRGLLPILLFGEQRHNVWLLPDSVAATEPGPFCAWDQHANHSATENG